MKIVEEKNEKIFTINDGKDIIKDKLRFFKSEL